MRRQCHVVCGNHPGSTARFYIASRVDSSIQHDIRYATANNFIGRPIEGYQSASCILSQAAAQALVRAQSLARSYGYSLKVYDCYRPRRAVAHFVAWARDLRDTKMQVRFYPAVPKSELFALGYIAEQSGHSRGSTVDLTLVPAESHQPYNTTFLEGYDCRGDPSHRYPDNSIDMGTGYDCFDSLAITDNYRIKDSARRNRDLLRSLMELAGFNNYDKEWWHYTLSSEPFPESYFDFPVKD